MAREQLSEFSRQEQFIDRIRSCAEKLGNLADARTETMTEAAHQFAEFADAADALVIDLSRDNLDLYRGGAVSDEGENHSPTVILEESVTPLLELLCDRYLDEVGIRIFDQNIVSPPEGVAADTLRTCLDELEMSQGFIVPLTVVRTFGPNKVQGILLIRQVHQSRFADPGHLSLLRMAADLLTMTADNVDLGNALSRLRPTDQFTGLASRSRILLQLAQEINRCDYFGRTLAVVLSDIDNLQLLNYARGYLYGELAIKSVSEDLLAEARPIDLVSRWGGEEFLVLMPEASLQDALGFAERCRARIETNQIRIDDIHEEVSITASFGVALYPAHGGNQDLLLRNADLSMLQAKLNGRNQVVVWSPEWLNCEPQT